MKRIHVAVIIVLAGLAAAIATGAAASYQVSSTDPMVACDLPMDLEKKIATFAKNNAITTDAQFQSGVAGMTAGSALELAAVKAIIGSCHLVP